MYVVLILLFLFLVCDEMRAKRSLRKAMGIKQPVGKVGKIGKAIRKAVKAAVREFREAREDSWEFHKAIQDARWEAREARIEKARMEKARLKKPGEKGRANSQCIIHSVLICSVLIRCVLKGNNVI